MRKNRTVLQVYCRGWFIPPFFAVFVCRIRRRGCDCQATGRACRRRSVCKGITLHMVRKKVSGTRMFRSQSVPGIFHGNRRTGRPCGRPRRSAEATRERQCPGALCYCRAARRSAFPGNSAYAARAHSHPLRPAKALRWAAKKPPPSSLWPTPGRDATAPPDLCQRPLQAFHVRQSRRPTPPSPVPLPSGSIRTASPPPLQVRRPL